MEGYICLQPTHRTGQLFKDIFHLKVINGVNLTQHLNLSRLFVVHICSVVHIQLRNNASINQLDQCLKLFNMISEMIDMNMIIRNLEVMTDGFINLVILHIKPCVRPSFPHLKSAKTCLISFGLCRILWWFIQFSRNETYKNCLWRCFKRLCFLIHFIWYKWQFQDETSLANCIRCILLSLTRLGKSSLIWRQKFINQPELLEFQKKKITH